MKFLCDRCKTKYSIADEKVRRKILKIRCKNCTNIITVRDPDAKADGGSKPSAAQQMPLENALSSAFSEEATVASNLPEFRNAATDLDEEWYYANAGQQQGPVPFSELASMVERAQVKEDAFIWREGFEDWIRADTVPELRPFFKKKLGTPAPATKLAPKREVPRPTDGKLAGKKSTPDAGVAAGGGKAAKDKKPAAARSKFDVGEDSMPDMSDSLELDENDSGEHDNSSVGRLGESVAPAASGLFAKADAGKIPDRKQENGTSGGDGDLEFSISEPSRIVKLDAILAARVGTGTGSKPPVGNQTGGVFKLPGLGEDAAAEAVSVAAAVTQTGPHARPAPSQPYLQSPLLVAQHRDHHLYKMLAIGGGVVSLVLIVVVLLLLHPGGGAKTIVIQKEKTPEDIGAEFAEQIAREEASKKFGTVALNKRTQDAIPPAHGSGGPPPRRSTMPPQPPHRNDAKVAGGGKTDDDRLAKLYGSSGGPSHEAPSPSRPAEDSLEPFKRGAKLCLDRALKKDPSLQAAKIDVKISITAIGGVSSVHIPSPYSGQFVGQCLSGVIKHLPWPPHGNAYDLEIPLLMSGG